MKNTKFAIAFLFIICYIQTLSAQDTFLKKYPSTGNKAIYSIIESDDNNLIFCGRIRINPGWTESIGTMMKVDMNGEVVRSINYNFDSGNSLFSELINPLSTNGYYLLSGSQDSLAGDTSYNTVFVHTIDNDLNIVTRRNYGIWTDTIHSPWDFEILGDTTAYILCELRRSNTIQFVYSLIKANLTNGDFDYFVADDTHYKAASSLFIDEISQLIKVNYRIFNVTNYPWNPVANFPYDLSSMEVVMTDNRFFSQTMMAKKNNSGYFLSGNVLDENTLQRNLAVAEYNLNDSLLYTVVLPAGIDTITNPSAGKKNILITSDYIWVMGWYNITQSIPCSGTPTFIMLNKLNHNMELIEQLFYGGDGVYYPRDIIETSDHHIVVAGEFFNNQAIPFNCHFDPFVLKVNSEGLIVNTNNNNMPQAHEAIVVPNPGNNYLQVKMGIQHKTAKFQLFDLNGRLIISEEKITDMQQINTSAIPKGIYPYKINTGNKVIGTGKWIKE